MTKFAGCVLWFWGVISMATSCPGQEARSIESVRGWEGTVAIPTYAWEEDLNPKFWAIEGGSKLSTTVRGSVVYPYVMQDHLLREKSDRTYRALFLENEFLKVTCLPELGGRLHSVFDKSRQQEMFYTNSVVKPGMIAMRGAWVSGGVEWNTGPHGHTVTAVSPVNALVRTAQDGSAYLEISNQEQLFRTRWRVRVTLYPDQACLEEQVCLSNPTDGMHPYYFWNCTAFPNRAGTRFIYPMSLGTDHDGKVFFQWPVDKGRDLTWLKNYDTYASVFAVNCPYDFFGAYDVEGDYGIVQYANRYELSGKKAWTWGEWEFGKVSQQNLTDAEGPYIEVQSGPLPTQSDYGMLGPQERVQWREWWYPVHGLGEGFEFASRDVAVQTVRRDGQLELRMLGTRVAPQVRLDVRAAGSRDGLSLAERRVDLTPREPAIVTLEDPNEPVRVRLTDRQGRVLALFQSPLPMPTTDPPQRAAYLDAPDDKLTAEELYLKGRKFDRATDRRQARFYYGKALALDSGHVAALRATAVLDFEAGLYDDARRRLDTALLRDPDDGLACYYRGLCALRLGNADDAMQWGYRAVRCENANALGYDLIGRAQIQRGATLPALASFERASQLNRDLVLAQDHVLLAQCTTGRLANALRLAERRLQDEPAALIPAAVVALENDAALTQFVANTRTSLGDVEYQILDLSLTLAEFGLYAEAKRLVKAACVDAVPADQRSFAPLYFLAWLDAQLADKDAAAQWLQQAAVTHKDRVFASRAEELPIWRYAVEQQPQDAQARLQFGCLLANLGRIGEAIPLWQEAADLGAGSIAWRNLGLVAAADGDVARAESCFRQAIAARPEDQTLYRDLAEILIADNRRAAAIELLEAMPPQPHRRAELTVILAESYMAEKRFDACIQLLESLPYFVNWEGQDVTWRLFNQSHIERGRQRLENGDAAGALTDFEAALTYPDNLNVGRSDKPLEAPAQYWRGQALSALGRSDAARAAWQAGADGAEVEGAQNEYRAKCREALGG